MILRIDLIMKTQNVKTAFKLSRARLLKAGIGSKGKAEKD